MTVQITPKSIQHTGMAVSTEGSVTPLLDKTGRAGIEGALSKQVAGGKNRKSYEAHNPRASSKGAQPRIATRPSPVIDLAAAKARSARDQLLETGLNPLARLQFTGTRAFGTQE